MSLLVSSGGGGTSGPVAAADITDAGTAGIAAIKAETPAQLRTAADAQPLDADLTALAGLSTTGLVARTGAGTAATRTIAGTANQITVTNGDGVAGNPTLSLPQGIATTSSPTFAGATINGNVGIGTSAPNAKLHVAGVSRENGLFVTGDNSPGLTLKAANGNEWEIFASGNGNGVAAGALAFFDNTVAAYRLSLSAAGALRFHAYGAGTLITDSSGNITASSDGRLKNVTGSFQRGLADVLKLQPKVYQWTKESGMNPDDVNVGFIAQDVLEVIPEAVGQYRTSEVEVDGKKTKKREKAELLTLSDRPLVAALVNAVKELKAENDALLARVSALENGKTTK